MKDQNLYLDSWARSVLADPIRKDPMSIENASFVNGVCDARIYLKNTYGYTEWQSGQEFFENWEVSSEFYQGQVSAYEDEINLDKPTYDFLKMSGDILDVGGLTGVVREHLTDNYRLLVVDPYIAAPHEIPKPKLQAYSCLSEPLNFIAGMAEFLPIRSDCFDWVHMRSMLDHVQVPDLALQEAARVLKQEGKLVIGMYVEHGKSGTESTTRKFKRKIKEALLRVGFERFRDHHTWHPTYDNLLKLLKENNFDVVKQYWQPGFDDNVVYVVAKKTTS